MFYLKTLILIMSDYTTAVKYAMFFFMALMLIEWVASKISNKKVYHISDTISISTKTSK